jgi:cyanophycin synthetase
MKILKTQTLRGPNYWSIRHQKLIVLRLDLEDRLDTLTHQIPGFYEGLVALLPGLQEHRSSEQGEAGSSFLELIKTGTHLGHVVEHIALELQNLAGMAVGFGRTRETVEPGIYQVVVEYLDEQAGRYALRAAVRMCQSIIAIGEYAPDELTQDLKDLQDFWAQASLGPSTENIVKEAEIRGIPWMALNSRAMIQFGQGRNAFRQR